MMLLAPALSLILSVRYICVLYRVRDEIDKEFACQSDLSHRREAATEKTRDLTNAKRELEREIRYGALCVWCISCADVAIARLSCSRFKLQKEQLDKWASEHAADPPPEVRLHLLRTCFLLCYISSLYTTISKLYCHRRRP